MSAEYVAAFHVIQECVWVKGVLSEMSLTVDPITLYMDSKSEIYLKQNQLDHKHSKHIKDHWIREQTMGGYPKVRPEHMGTEYMDADNFTKSLE